MKISGKTPLGVEQLFKEIIMPRQFQYHSVLARKYYKMAAVLKARMGVKPDADQIKAHQDFLDLGEQHQRIAFLFPQCDQFLPAK